MYIYIEIYRCTYLFCTCVYMYICIHIHMYDIHDTFTSISLPTYVVRRGGGLGSSTIFKKFNEQYAPS